MKELARAFLADPILGNPLLWCLFLFAVFYFGSILFSGREDERWRDLQRERMAKLRRGEPLEPCPPYYVDSQRRVNVDVAGLIASPQFKETQEICRRIVAASRANRHP